jgi:hypothetical protein
MKITKILVALSFLFAVATAQAGTLTVTGNMEATYQSEVSGTTGNPLGMDRELKFAGSTELDNGITVSVFQDTSDSLAYGNSQIAFGNIMGFATIYVGSDADPVDGIDDVTPSAYEEANGSGSGTYVDIGSLAGQMGIGTKFSLPILGAVDYKYYPKVDGALNKDNVASADTSGSVGSGSSLSINTNLADLPIVGGALDGATLRTGYSENANSTVADTDDVVELTAALNYAYGPVSFGVQKKYNNLGQTAAGSSPSGADAVWYKDTVIGVAYAVNDSLSISYNRYTSQRHKTASANAEQETDAINIGYTVGGMTIGFQDAQTDNAGYTLNSKDDTRTIGVSVAF